MRERVFLKVYQKLMVIEIKAFVLKVPIEWGTFANSGGHTKSIRFLPVKLNIVFGKFLLVFYEIFSSMSKFWLDKGCR